MASALLRSKSDSTSFLEPTKHNSRLITCLGDLKTTSYGEGTYLTRSPVYRTPQMAVDELELTDEPHRSDGFKNKAEKIVGDEVNVKIQKTLRRLTLRDPCNLIQFWSPCRAGKYKLLKTVDQPFGLGTLDERLYNYRRESERKRFRVDEECKEVDLVPVVRVFRCQFPEWTPDVTKYYSKNHPLRDCAIRGDLHGYLVLPVFDSFTMSCVGVLESITSSRYLDCAYEVQEVHQTLKAVNLTSPQAFDFPISYVARGFKSSQNELDEIFKILKDCCFTHKLPLAQTWKVSSASSFVATERNIEMSCNSFNSSCIGEVCMSTTDLPFHVHDLRVWHFREACREHHLIKSKGVVGRALSSHGSCFCADVTKLREDEYSLVHNVCMSGLTSCLAIYLHSREHDDGYVLEFFLPVDMNNCADSQNLVQKLKLHVKSPSFDVGTEDISMDDVTGKNIDVVTGEKGACTKQRRKRKMDSITPENIMQYFGKPMEEASTKLGVSRSTLKRVCRKFNIASWPMTNRNKKTVRFGIYVAVFLLIRVKRWSCSSNHHGFSARWWICGKHNSFVISRLNPSPEGEMIRMLLSSSQRLKEVKEPDESTETATPFSKPTRARFGIYYATRLLLGMIRWRKRAAIQHTSGRNDYKFVDGQMVQISDTFDVFHASASPKKKVAKVLDECRMVTVKATYKDDMIKFRIPISSGLLELKNQVAQRIKLENTKLHLKYRDEDDDLILIACDADFHNLVSLSPTSVSNHTIKLIVQIAKK
ncbi:putative transcription factor Nin-like family [Helianthus annuus]|nr:putative transcription factor Nin-like family [Helianthus annuus]